MTRAVLRFFLCAAVTACLAAVMSVDAAAIVLNPTTDGWLRQSAPNHAFYESDLLSVWTPGPDQTRLSLLSFDLSGITQPIASARLELYAIEYFRNATAARQSAALITPTTIPLTTTWNSFPGDFAQTELETFGAYNLPADSPQEQYYASSSASAADLAAMNAQKAATGSLAFVLNPETWTETQEVLQGRREWADLEGYRHPSDSQTRPAKLLINGGDAMGGQTLTVADDTWLHERTPDTDRKNDWCSVWSHESNGDPLQRWGLLQFDLNSVTQPITSAVLAMFAISTATSGGANAEPFIQDASLVDVAGPVSGLTWNSYQSAGHTEQPLDSLGHYSFDADTENDRYFDSDAASTLDAAALEDLRLGDGKATLLLKALPIMTTEELILGGQRDWGDMGYLSQNPEMWPRLVIEEVPEPSTIALILCGSVVLLAARRRRSP